MINHPSYRPSTRAAPREMSDRQVRARARALARTAPVRLHELAAAVLQPHPTSGSHAAFEWAFRVWKAAPSVYQD